jgi:molybdopterin-guanine dinucleotide biosynthesis protein A
MVTSFLERIPRLVIGEDDLGGGEAARRTFFNVNTPDDLRRAEEMLAQAQPRR